MTKVARCDYGLLGEDGRLAAEAGLANADLYRCPVDRKRMKQLMQRSDTPAIVSSMLWLGLMIGLAVVGVPTWAAWWSIPIFIAYGVLWGSGGDSRCHGTGHGRPLTRLVRCRGPSVGDRISRPRTVRPQRQR